MAPKCAAAAAPSSSTDEDGETSSGDSTSSAEHEVADKGVEESETESEEDSTPMAAVKEEFQEEEEDEVDEEEEEEWDEDEEEEADEEDEEEADPDLLPSSKRVDHPVTAALKEEVREDVDLQPISKRIDPRAPVLPEEPAPENPSQPTNSPARDRKRASSGEIGKSPAPARQKSKSSAQHSELTAEPRSKRIRRPWAPDDEVLILEALAQHRRQHGELPTWWDSDFFESIRERLEDNSFHAFAIRDKARSLHRRYESRVVSTTDHDVRIHDLCRDIWGDLPPIDGNEEEADGVPAIPWGAEDGDDGQAENGGTTRSDTTTKGFKEMCEKYPLLAQEVKLLAKAQPSFESSFARLDAKRARDIEKKLETVKYAELKFETRMVLEIHAPKAKISKKLISLLAKVPKNV